jgi:hypothetical protein
MFFIQLTQRVGKDKKLVPVYVNTEQIVWVGDASGGAPGYQAMICSAGGPPLYVLETVAEVMTKIPKNPSSAGA